MSIANDNCSWSSWRGAPLMRYHGMTLAAQHISDGSKCITTVLYSIRLSFCICLADVLAALCCWIRVGECSLAVVHSYDFLWAFSSGVSKNRHGIDGTAGIFLGGQGYRA